MSLEQSWSMPNYYETKGPQIQFKLAFLKNWSVQILRNCTAVAISDDPLSDNIADYPPPASLPCKRFKNLGNEWSQHWSSKSSSFDNREFQNREKWAILCRDQYDTYPWLVLSRVKYCPAVGHLISLARHRKYPLPQQSANSIMEANCT